MKKLIPLPIFFKALFPVFVLAACAPCCTDNGVSLPEIVADASVDGSVAIPEVRQLQVVFVVPGDVVSVEVKLYRGKDNTGMLVEERALAAVEYRTLFEDLEPGFYWVEAQADAEGKVNPFYFGQGGLEIRGYGTVLFDLLMNEKCIGGDDICVEVPRIESVMVAGRAVLANEIDYCSGEDLYVPAPVVNQSLRFFATASHPEGEPLIATWTVKDGPGWEDEDVGQVASFSADGFESAWVHDREGIYYIHLNVNDTKGGADSFSFNVFVMPE